VYHSTVDRNQVSHTGYLSVCVCVSMSICVPQHCGLQSGITHWVFLCVCVCVHEHLCTTALWTAIRYHALGI